ncbi:MAG TPA: Gfo/Idh/MocA family oxidoreductase [Solirubrobacterales bacterium]|nr:Gfo/Idh/MocA family oxidoreductase [Solirubrobacterales bacterium]
MLQVGMVGLGYWGPSLLRALFDLPNVQVKWICDRDPERLARYERRYPGVMSTLRIDDVLEDDAVDAVVIATPVYTHFYLASRALHAGKHAFVEKPLAASSREADELVRVAESKGLALMCGHTFIYSPAVRAVRTMLEQGELGELFFVSSSRVNLGLHQQDISVIWDLGPHDFSMLLYWFDEMPEKVRAVGRDSIVKGISDVAFVTLDFPSGLLANVELSWLAPSKLRRTVIVGSERMVVYDDGSTEPIKVFNHGVVYQDPETFGEYHLSYRTGDIVSPKIDAAEPILLELSDFVAAVEAREAPLGHLDLARNVARLTEAAEESLRTGGDVSLRGRTRFAELIEPRGE